MKPVTGIIVTAVTTFVFAFALAYGIATGWKFKLTPKAPKE